MLYDQQAVPLSQIIDDRTFRISTEYDISRLAASMQRFGLINFPILKARNDSFQIISGFSRIDAARVLGWEQVPARVVPAEHSLQNNCLLAIIDNTAHRALNIVEQARAVHLLSQTISSVTELISLARTAGTFINQDMLAKLKDVNRMPPVFQKGLIDGSIALPVALRLFRWSDPGGAQTLAELLLELNLSLNRQRELVDWVEAIIHRDAISIGQLLNEDELVHWRLDHQGDRAFKLQKIREYLKYRRYPEISTAQDRFSATLKELRLPPGMRLVPPPFFEGPTFSLQIDFKSHKDFPRMLDEIARIGKSPLLKILLDSFTD